MAGRGRDGGGGGAIAAGHPVTAEAGARILAEGGNACDALVGAGLASWAAEPALTGPGGGGFLLYREAAGGRVTLLDFFVAVPGLGATRASGPMTSFDVEFGARAQRFRIGAASCAVPGVPAGLGEAHRRWGSRPWGALAETAAHLADAGVPLTAEHDALHRILTPVLTAGESACSVFAPSGRLAQRGEPVAQPALARTIERLAEQGAEEFYRGATGTAIVEEVAAGGGTMTLEDLARYRVVVRRPVEVGYRGRQLTTNAPPSTGGLLLAYALALGDRLPPPAGPLDADAACRAAVLLHEAEARRSQAFARLLERGGARRLLEPASLDEGAERVAELLAGRASPLAAMPVARGTSHISVVDARGNAAAMTCSTGCGSGVFAGTTGVHLNNMLGEDDLAAEGVRLRPGSRLTSMMAPTVIAGPGSDLAVLGSSGSERIRSALHRVVTGLVDHGLDARPAVEAPRLHPRRDGVDLEPGFDLDVPAALAALGLDPLVWPDRNIYFGGAQVALSRGGRLDAAGDPRRGGAGLVVEP